MGQSRVIYRRLRRVMSGFENLKGRRPHSSSGQPVPVLSHLHVSGAARYISIFSTVWAMQMLLRIFLGLCSLMA